MSVSGGRISNLSIKIGTSSNGDLQQVFGTSNTSTSWYFQSAPINMWSKCKPFISSSVYYDRYTDSNSSRLSGLASAGYGINIPTNWDPANIYNSVCTYNRPNGSSSQLWRTLDFDGYAHNVGSPMSTMGDKSVAPGSSIDMTGCLGSIMPSLNGGLSISELGMTSWYLCAVFSTTSNFTGTLKLKTSSQHISQQVNGCTLTITSSDIATLQSGGYCYYFMCGRNAAQTTLTNYSFNNGWAYTVLPANGSVRGNFTITSSPTPTYSVPFTVNLAAGLGITNSEAYVTETYGGYDTSLDAQAFSYHGSAASDSGDLDAQTSVSTLYYGIYVDAACTLSLSYRSYSNSGYGFFCELAVPVSAISSGYRLTINVS